MEKFNTLMRREWMQHHRGWLALMLAPPLIVLLMLPFGSVEIDGDDLGPTPALALMLIAMAAAPAAVLGITAVSMLFQTPGLARRDRQDRSIEFWLSLPTGHSASIGATVLMHLVLVPMLALLVGAAFGVPIGFGLVWRAFGAAEAFGLPWGQLALAGVAGVLRALLGVALACAWLMPLLLATMAASAWLKRWGVPVLAISLGLAHKLLSTLYGITWIGDIGRGLIVNARQALMPPRIRHADQMLAAVADAPRWLFGNALDALRDLGQPLFLFALIASAACFALLVWRRSRNG